MAKNLPARHVPCNGCTLCCQGDAVRLLEEDMAMGYKTEPHPYMRGTLMIAHKPNGECFYLQGTSCSIHDHAPALCRSGDCRSLALRFNFETARLLHQMRRLNIQVWDQGRKLVEEMKQKPDSKRR